MSHSRRRQREVDVGRKPTGGQVIAIVSGKGGVGKTNLALNLGLQLARRRRVILLDADFGLANADILLNVSPLADFSDLLDPDRNLDDLLVEGPCGLRVLCGVSETWSARVGADFAPQECVWAMERLRGASDVLIVDCGNTVNLVLAAIAGASDLLLLATTPEPTALADGYAVVKYLSNHGFAGRTGVVVNMARTRTEGQAAGRRLARVAYQFLGLSVEQLGCIPFDRHVPQAVRHRVPVVLRHPHCAASVGLEEVCSRLWPPSPGGRAGGGLWSRLAALFL